MKELWVQALFIAAIALLIGARVHLNRRKYRRRRQQFLESHPPLPNKAFAEQLGLTDEGQMRVAIAIRSAIAQELRLPEESIRPSDDLMYLTTELQYFVVGPISEIMAVVAEAGGIRVNRDYVWEREMEGDGPGWEESFGGFVMWWFKHWDRVTVVE